MNQTFKYAVFAALVAIIAIGGFFSWRLFFEETQLLPQSTKVWRVVIFSGSKAFGPENVAGFKKRMGELGYKEGVDMLYTKKEAGSDKDLLKQYIKEVSEGEFDIVIPTSSAVSRGLLAVPGYKTPTFVIESSLDGTIKNFVAPESFITGLADSAYLSAPKRLEILKEIKPSIKKVASIIEKGHIGGENFKNLLLEKAPSLGIEMSFLEISVEDKAKKNAIASLTRDKVDGYISCTCLDQISSQVSEQLIKEKIPSINHISNVGVQQGFLISYTANHFKAGERVAEQLNEFIKGKPISQIPVQYEKDLVLEINLKTAKSIGLTIPKSVLLRANKIYQE